MPAQAAPGSLVARISGSRSSLRELAYRLGIELDDVSSRTVTRPDKVKPYLSDGRNPEHPIGFLGSTECTCGAASSATEDGRLRPFVHAEPIPARRCSSIGEHNSEAIQRGWAGRTATGI